MAHNHTISIYGLSHGIWCRAAAATVENATIEAVNEAAKSMQGLIRDSMESSQNIPMSFGNGGFLFVVNVTRFDSIEVRVE